jgi:hypothetical protein
MVRKPVGERMRPLIQTDTDRDPLVISLGRLTSSSVDTSGDGDVKIRALVESLSERATDSTD